MTLPVFPDLKGASVFITGGGSGIGVAPGPSGRGGRTGARPEEPEAHEARSERAKRPARRERIGAVD